MNSNDSMPGLPESRCQLNIPDCDGSHGALTERNHEGFTVWVDERGSIRHRKNTGIVGGKQRSRVNGTIKVDSQLSKLVLGELEASGATPASLAIAKRLLQIASTQKGAQAVQALDRLAVRIGESWEARRPGPTQVCPLCSRKASGDIHITMSEGTMEDVRRFSNMIPNDNEDTE